MYVEFEAYRDFGTRHRSFFRGCCVLAKRTGAAESTYRFSKFLACTIINRSADLIPPHVRICKKSFVDWGSCCQREHYRSERAQLIV